MKNSDSHIDEIFRDGLNNFEVPFNESHWNEMESKIDQSLPSPGKSSWSAGKVAMIAGTVALIATAVYMSTEPGPAEEKNIPASQNAVITEDQQTKSEDVVEAKKSSSQNTTDVTSTTEGSASDDNKSMDHTQEKQTPEKNVEDEISHKTAMSEHSIVQQANEFSSNDVPKPIEDKSTANFNNRELKTTFSMSNTSVCAGESVDFTVDRDLEGVSYFWNFGDGGTSTKKNPSRVFNKAGNYDVTLIVSGGEKNDYQTVKTIKVRKLSNVDINWDDTELSLEDPYIEFSTKEEAGTEYIWKIDGRTFEGSVAQHPFKKKGNYLIELNWTSGNCSGKSSKEFVLTQDPPPYIETAFQLDNDGFNDAFPKILQTLSVDFMLEIFDPNGRMVYKTNNKNQAWNGRFNNSGELVNPGNYKYSFIWTDNNGKQHRYSGIVKVLK